MSKLMLKRRHLLAYLLCLCSCCLFLWVLTVIANSNYSISLSHNAHMPIEKRAAVSGVPAQRQGKGDQHLKETNQSLRENPPVVIPGNITVLNGMSWKNLSSIYHNYLNENQIVCSDIQRVGKVTDGGWNICADSAFAPPKTSCLVYSFGIGEDFSFDDDIVKKYDCKIYSFDPSMKIGNQKRGEKSFFMQMGLADSDRTMPNGWAMSRFDTLRLSLKHTKTHIHTVKMDIEEMEWEVLPDLLTSDSLRHSGVRQLLIELHQCDGCSKYRPNQEDLEPPRERYIHMLGILNTLYQQGFRIFSHHANSACRYEDKFTHKTRSACMEIGFVRV